MKTNSAVGTKPTSLEERALALLVYLPPGKVAESLGVDPSRISQLLADEEFKEKLATEKFEALNKHNNADAELDQIEDAVRARLLENIDQVYKPFELLKILQVVNLAKRKGSVLPVGNTEVNKILNLTMPVTIIQQFTTNISNQVTRVGDMDLLTIQSSTIANNLKELEKQRVLEYDGAEAARGQSNGR